MGGVQSKAWRAKERVEGRPGAAGGRRESARQAGEGRIAGGGESSHGSKRVGGERAGRARECSGTGQQRRPARVSRVEQVCHAVLSGRLHRAPRSGRALPSRVLRRPEQRAASGAGEQGPRHGVSDARGLRRAAGGARAGQRQSA